MRKAVERLRPVATATEDVEQDKAGISTVMQYVHTSFSVYDWVLVPSHLHLIKAHWSGQSDLTTFHTPALQALEKRCIKHFNGGLFFLAKALAPKADLSSWPLVDRNKVSAMLTSYCVPLLTKLGHNEDVLPALRGQLGQWVSRSGPVCIPVGDPNPLDYWHQMAIHMPLLAKVAVAVHSVCPSEACVERSFSQQGLLHSDLRVRLTDKSIKSLMTVRMNILRLYDVPAMPRQKRQRVM